MADEGLALVLTKEIERGLPSQRDIGGIIGLGSWYEVWPILWSSSSSILSPPPPSSSSSSSSFGNPSFRGNLGLFQEADSCFDSFGGV